MRHYLLIYGSIQQESVMSLRNLLKSLKNKDESVTGSRAIPSILTFTVGLIDTSGNNVLQDTVLSHIKSGENLNRWAFKRLFIL